MTARHSLLIVATAFLALFVSSGRPSAATQAAPLPLEVNALLDAYARGDRDRAIAAVSSANRRAVQAVRTSLVDVGHSWVHAVPDDLNHRIFSAAAFALEFEAARMERGDWVAASYGSCGARCAIEWACTILRARGAPDAAEREWLLASITLVNGVRDWTFLLSPLSPPGPRTRVTGHVQHALTRFPNEPRFKLARAMALASRYEIADEMDASRENERTGPVQTSPALPVVVIRTDPRLRADADARRQQLIDYARAELTVLTQDPVVGGEAQMRVAYLHWRLGEYDDAMAAAQQATAHPAITADQKYIAGMIAAQAAQAAGQFDDAERFYAVTLAGRPDSQSASIGLAALKFFRGDAAAAYDLIERSRANRANDDDPWRLLLYGDYPHMAERIAAVRAAVQR